jgi:hypothetical protein
MLKKMAFFLLVWALTDSHKSITHSKKIKHVYH